MTLDRAALVSPKLLAGAITLLIGLFLIALAHYRVVGVGDEMLQLLQQGTGSAQVSRLAERWESVQTLMSIAWVIAVIVILVVAISISQSLIGPLRRTIEYAGGIAKGRLGTRATYWASGEVKNVREAVSDMQEQLTSVVSRVADCSGQVQNSSVEMDNVAEQLVHDMRAHVDSISGFATEMNTIADSVVDKLEETEKLSQLVDRTRESLEKGSETVEKTIEVMGKVNDSSNKISEIISIIDDIAFQTNLLALNASVEAARSGDHGRGFAVVANEVRNLAQRSADSARDIKGLIEESVTIAKQGVSLVDSSGKTLEDSMGSYRQVSESIAELATMTRRQSEEIRGVSAHVGQLKAAVGQTAGLAEEVTRGSQQLHHHSSNLNNIISYFTVRA